jgi:hypothetical protein
MNHQVKTQIESHVNPEVYLDPTNLPLPHTGAIKRPRRTSHAACFLTPPHRPRHTQQPEQPEQREPAPLFAPKAQGTDIAIRCLQYLHLFPTATPRGL